MDMEKRIENLEKDIQSIQIKYEYIIKNYKELENLIYKILELENKIVSFNKVGKNSYPVLVVINLFLILYLLFFV
jgi:prefoldin subunit 5